MAASSTAPPPAARLLSLFSLLLLAPAAALDFLGSAGRVQMQRPRHYLSFDLIGDLTNQWECIMNAGMLAAKMQERSSGAQMALVVPGIYRTANGRFSDVYDLVHFRSHMKELGVDVVEQVPSGVEDVALKTVENKGLDGYVGLWLPTLQQYQSKDVHFSIAGEANLSWETYYARQLEQCEKEHSLCKPMFEGLQYTPAIKGMADTVLEELNKKGDWLPVHVHDFQPFLCHGDRDLEVGKVKERLDQNHLNPKNLYIVGYVDDLDHVKSLIGRSGMEVINKHSILGAKVEGLPFQESAAIDQSVIRHAARYITKPGSSFDALANSIRHIQGTEVATYKMPGTWRGCESEEEEAKKKAVAK